METVSTQKHTNFSVILEASSFSRFYEYDKSIKIRQIQLKKNA